MAEKNTVPNLEAKASDGNQLFTPRQWLERFRQFTKREHKIDITPLIKGEDITEAGWTAEKETNIQEDFIWGVGPEALYQITRAEYKTEPDSIKIKDLIRLYTEHYLPKHNTYHNRRLLLGKTIGKRDNRRILEKTHRDRKGMQLRQYISRRITKIQIHDGDNRQETTGQTNERENIRDEENDRNDQTKNL